MVRPLIALTATQHIPARQVGLTSLTGWLKPGASMRVGGLLSHCGRAATGRGTDGRLYSLVSEGWGGLMTTIKILALLGGSAAALTPRVAAVAAAQGVQAQQARPVAANRRTQSRTTAPGPPSRAPAPLRRRLPPAIWDPVSVQDLVYFIRQVGAEGLDPSFYDPDGSRGGAAHQQSGFLFGGGNRALQRARLGPRARPRPQECADRLAYRRQGSRLCRARQLAADRARQRGDGRGAERPASDPSAICGAQGRARDDPGGARPPSATGSGSTWTAGAGCRATSATNISSSTSPDSTRRWSRTASIAGSTRRLRARPRRRPRSWRCWPPA